MTTPQVVAALQEDGGVFQVLLKNYDEALAFFRKRALEDPCDLVNLHHLGLTAATKIQMLNRWSSDEERLQEAQEHLIVGWAPVFAADDFWHGWWADRIQMYQTTIEEAQIQDARDRLLQFWLRQLAAGVGVAPGPDVVFRAELLGARAVLDGEGIPVPDRDDRRAVVGPLGAKMLGLDQAVAQWVASFDPESVRIGGWPRQVCRLFSELAVASALFEDSRFAETIAALSQPRCDLRRRGDRSCPLSSQPAATPYLAATSCPCFREANPALSLVAGGNDLLRTDALDLLLRSHLELALAAVSRFPVNLVATLEHWQEAVGMAAQVGRTDEILEQVRQVVINRATDLRASQRDSDSRLDALNDAVNLLEQFASRGWDNESRDVVRDLAESLLDRAVYVSDKYNNERQARSDAQHAYGMVPGNARAVAVICWSNFHYAREKYLGGESDAARALTGEADELVREWEQLSGPDATKKFLERLKELKILIGIDASPETPPLNGSSPLPPDEEEKNRKWGDASIEEGKRNYERAVELLWEIVQSAPGNSGRGPGWPGATGAGSST